MGSRIVVGFLPEADDRSERYEGRALAGLSFLVPRRISSLDKRRLADPPVTFDQPHRSESAFSLVPYV
jgi:hypothetical protein